MSLLWCARWIWRWSNSRGSRKNVSNESGVLKKSRSIRNKYGPVNLTISHSLAKVEL